MEKERRIEWHAKNRQICQIPKDGLEYAFVSEDFKQIHQFVWCKDFMQDAIFGYVNKKRILIYGFEYDPATYPPIYMKQTRLLLANWKDLHFGDKLLNNCRTFLHEIETKLKMRKTTFEVCADPPARYKKSGVYFVTGSSRWMISPPMISLYTLLLRVGMVHPLAQPFIETLRQIRDNALTPYNWKVGDDHDGGLLRDTFKGVEKILAHGDRKIFYKKIEKNYPLKDHCGSTFPTYTIHDNCGMVGFSRRHTESNFPYWHRI